MEEVEGLIANLLASKLISSGLKSELKLKLKDARANPVFYDQLCTELMDAKDPIVLHKLLKILTACIESYPPSSGIAKDKLQRVTAILQRSRVASSSMTINKVSRRSEESRLKRA